MTDRRPFASAAPVARAANNHHTGANNHNTAATTAAPVWHACPHCTSTPTFQTTADFVRHLQTKHCTRLDVTSPNTTKKFVCRFGPGGTCIRQIATGQQQRADQDDENDNGDDEDDDSGDTFEQHVLRHHLSPIVKRKVSTASNRSVSSAQIFGASGPSTIAEQHSTTTDSEADWTIFSSTQNLPAVLNDPSRGKQSTLFTKKWGDTFVEKTSIPPSPYLADVTYGDLDAYLQRIGKRFRRHQRLKHIATTASTSSDTTDLDTTSSAAGDNISDIPVIFLHQQLQLNDPTIFAQVFAGLEAPKKDQSIRLGEDDASAEAITAARASAVAAGATARLHLQEKLSHYLDIVEMYITRKVSQQSGAFFAAMTSQHTIVAEMHAAMLNVRRLREQIAAADATLVRDALHICAARRRQQNQAYVVHKLKIMAEVHKTQPMIQLLLGTADYVAAIDLIGTTQELLSRELRDVHCLKHLPSQLNEMERLIDKMLRTEFERFATADLNRRHVEPAGSIIEDAELGAAAVVVVEDEEKLVSIVWGLLRQRNFSFIDTYRDEAIVTVRALIKEMLIEVLASGDAECCLTGAGEESQSLSIGEWIQLLDGATVRLLRLLRRVRAIVGVMRRIAAQSAGRPTTVEDVGFYRNEAFLSAAELQRVDGRLVELMHTVCNYCHERCATLISSQSLERSVATAGQIERLQRIVRTFSAGCEVLTGGGGADAMVCLPLLAALKAQATRFAQKFHADRKAKLALLLDSERWRQTEVPGEIQRLVDAIAAGRWQDSCARTSRSTAQPPTTADDRNGGDNTTAATALLVGDDAYVLCGSALILLQIVDEYARCAAQLPVVAAQLARHVVDLLRTFNSRCCQLVLGAGALRVAGLKTITSANLALVARALQLVVWLLPHIRGHFQRAADGKPQQETATTATSEASTPTAAMNGNGVHSSNQTSSSNSGYDIVERDLLSHIAEIDTMILSIVTQLVHSQLDAWTARPPVPSSSFRNISRHFVKLHEALAPIMPAVQVRRIYAVVHRTFKDKLREQLQRHGVVNNGGPAHGVVTAELTFYTETVRTLGVFGDGADADELSDEAMADVWRK